MTRPERPDGPEATLTPGVLLSGVTLLSGTGGTAVDLRSGRGPRALVTLHSGICPEFYVANIYRYYVAYRLAQMEEDARKQERERLRGGGVPASPR